MEICSGTIFTEKTRCTTHLHQILPVGEIYHKSSDQIWAPLPGNGNLSTHQHCRLGLTHYGACLMTENTSSRSKVANSFSHSGYISWLHTYSGWSGNLKITWAGGGVPKGQMWHRGWHDSPGGSRWSIGGIIYKAWNISPKSRKKTSLAAPEHVAVDGSSGYERMSVIYLPNIVLRDSIFIMLA